MGLFVVRVYHAILWRRDSFILYDIVMKYVYLAFGVRHARPKGNLFTLPNVYGKFVQLLNVHGKFAQPQNAYGKFVQIQNVHEKLVQKYSNRKCLQENIQRRYFVAPSGGESISLHWIQINPITYTDVLLADTRTFHYYDQVNCL